MADYPDKAFVVQCDQIRDFEGSGPMRYYLVELGRRIDMAVTAISEHIPNLSNHIFEAHRSWDFGFMPALANHIAEQKPYIRDSESHPEKATFLNMSVADIAGAMLELLPESVVDDALESQGEA